MTTSLVTRLAIALTLLGATACTANVSAVDKGDEADAPADGKFDGASISEHGALVFPEGNGSSNEELKAYDDVELSSSARSHGWTFNLDGDAEVSLETRNLIPSGQDEVDSVMYLYKRTESGTWGRYLRRNDDANADTVFSAIDESLGEGEYRVVVKGYSRASVGDFMLFAYCTGDGCVGGEPGPICGQELADLNDDDVLVAGHSNDVRSNTRVNMLLSAQIIRAVSQTVRARNPITDWRVALEMVDTNSMRATQYTVAATGEELTLLEFRKSRKLYGTFFNVLTTDVFAHMEDGEVIGCAE